MPGTTIQESGQPTDYILEIYYKGDRIEQRHRSDPFMTPAVGEKIHLSFQNTAYSDEYGNWWIVRGRRHLFHSATPHIQTLMLDCEPAEAAE
jgi:hypothetical protein